MNSNPNAEEQRWQDQLRAVAEDVTGGPVEVHHISGSKSRHNKLHIGEWFVIAIPKPVHDLLGTQEGRDTVSKKLMGFQLVGRWDIEKYMFFVQVGRLPKEFPLPAPEILDAIADYHR